MPVVSQAQRRWAYATSEGKTDAPASVGREFVEASHGITGLPKRVKKQSGARSEDPVVRSSQESGPQSPGTFLESIKYILGGPKQGGARYQSGARERDPPRRHFGSMAPHRVVIHVFPHHEEWT